MLLLATYLKDMTDEELLEAFLPMLPIIILFVAIYAIIIVKIVRFFFCKRNPRLKGLFRYMNKTDFHYFISQTSKLQKFLDKCIASSIKLIVGVETCPICGKTYSKSTKFRETTNEHGDKTEQYVDGCPRCNTSLTYQDGYVLKREPTNSKRESIYAADFRELKSLIDVHKPKRPESGGDSDSSSSNGNITVNVYINT